MLNNYGKMNVEKIEIHFSKESIFEFPIDIFNEYKSKFKQKLGIYLEYDEVFNFVKLSPDDPDDLLSRLLAENPQLA